MTIICQAKGLWRNLSNGADTNIRNKVCITTLYLKMKRVHTRCVYVTTAKSYFEHYVYGKVNTSV